MRPLITPRITPALSLLVLAPFLGEVTSTSTPLPTILMPQIGLFAMALYGGGALLIREVALRRGLGLHGLVLLAAAYGVFEEALLVGSWFAPAFFDTPAQAAYSWVWGTNVIQALHLTLFHVTISIWCSIALVELLYPNRRTTPWVGRRGLRFAAAGLLATCAVARASEEFFAVPGPQFLAALVLVLVLIALGLRRPRRPGRPRPEGPVLAPTPAAFPVRLGTPGAARRPRFAAPTIAAAAGMHFVLVWTLPSSTVPWPLGLLIAVLPLVWAYRVCRRLRADTIARAEQVALTVIIGVLTPLFVIDVLVGLGGRIDLLVTAVITVAGLAWIRRRTLRRAGAPGGVSSAPADHLGVQIG